MDIKDIFDGAEDGKLTYEQFAETMKARGAKFADLSDGKYVSTSKYNADLKAKDTALADKDSQIQTLNDTITSRDTDLASLQQQLNDAGQDAQKLADVTGQLSALQSQYEADKVKYQQDLLHQKYGFAVSEYANQQKFTSNAAKRDFKQAMMAKNLQMEGDRLIGADDFRAMYAEENSDAFKVEEPVVEEPVVEPVAPQPVPTIVASATGPQENPDGSSLFNFNFVGVRGHE